MKKKIILLLIIVLSIIVIPVNAKELDNFKLGEDLDINKKINATLFSAGNNVNVSSEIDGANFVAGNNVSISSSQDVLFTAGNNVDLDKVFTKDAFVAGSLIKIKSSNIRDLYAAAETIMIDSDISRNAYLGANEVTINSKINGNVDISAEKIKIGKDAEITGTINYPENADITIANTAKIGAKTTYKQAKVEKEETIIQSIIDKVLAFISMLVIGLILIALNKKVFKQIEEIKKDFKTMFKEFAFGFMFLVAVPVASIIILCTVIGVPISIISLILYGILIYLSVIPTAYYFGDLVFKDKLNNKYLVFAIALLCIYILRFIPVIGPIVTFISLCFGLGVYTQLLNNHIKEK